MPEFYTDIWGRIHKVEESKKTVKQPTPQIIVKKEETQSKKGGCGCWSK